MVSVILELCFVKDICHSNNDKIHKAYIVIFTYSISKTVMLDLVEDNTSKNFTSQEKESFCGKQGISLIYFNLILFNLEV